MKNLKDICNANIPNSLHSLLEGLLQGQDATINETIDLSLLCRSTTCYEFNSNAQLIKAVIENEGKGPFSHKQLKKGKSYVYAFYDDWSSWSDDDGWVIAFVDKYPKQDPDTDFNDDTYYVIFWDDYINSVSCRYDNTACYGCYRYKTCKYQA